MTFFTASWFLKRRSHCLLPLSWLDKAKLLNTPPNSLYFNRVKCKHLAWYLWTLHYLSPVLLPIFFSWHHFFPFPHSAQCSKEPFSHINLWYMFIANDNSLHISPVWQKSYSLKTQLRSSLLLERLPRAALTPPQFISHSNLCHHFITASPLGMFFVPDTILTHVFINWPR